MDGELNKEAAEMIGQYTRRGKNDVLSRILENGGIVKKEIQSGEISGRSKGSERVLYYCANGRVLCYDPIRVRIAEKYRNN